MRRDAPPSLAALDQIEDLLEAYAEARLTPAGPVLARMRRTVVQRAATEAAEQAAIARAQGDGARPGRFPVPAWLPRPRVPAATFALAFSVALGLGTGAAVLAAPPGSPFFNARIVLEQVLLPTQIDARLAAHEAHLEARLAEAEAAAARGDTAALVAALAAFEAEVDQVAAEGGLDAERLAHLEAMLAKHVAILTTLEAEVPEQAAIDQALENSQKAIVKVNERKKSAPPGAPGGRPADRGPQD